MDKYWHGLYIAKNGQQKHGNISFTLLFYKSVAFLTNFV